jgi:deoxycytidylate deaminase
MGVYADKTTRWERVKGPDKYNNDWKAFDRDDENDSGTGNELFGQRVSDCFSEADVVISNNVDFKVRGNEPFEEFRAFINRYVDLIEDPLKSRQPIRSEETLMAMAYATSQQSSCLKRKVGALIVDGMGTIVSSGYNEVPRDEKPCMQEYRNCHRDHLCDNFFNELAKKFPEILARQDQIRSAFREQFKMLDYCRALHAEENAILNLVRNGQSVSLRECTLYTTTYPCRLCAQKIANIKMKRVVYLEPYPQSEAKDLLNDADVIDEFFQGITFRAYFRIYGDQK